MTATAASPSHRPAHAHSRNDDGRRHDLVAHLRAVADEAARFAEAFGAGELARWLGLWHDVGKFAPAFQEYLLACEAHPDRPSRGPDHKAAGALIAAALAGPGALIVQGHHGGLRTREDLKAWLAERERDPATREALRRARSAIADLEPPGPLPPPAPAAAGPRSMEFLVRMVFSALVDADFLDTERHFQPHRADLRGRGEGIGELWTRFEEGRGRVIGGGGAVASVREEVYEACLRAASMPPGLFRLTVPTGGGKTLSGLAFALRHALRHGQRRIVVAVPFTSITEQTADVYRRVLERPGDSAPLVLEHHTGAAAADGDGASRRDVWSRLSAENWDAPVVVTTTVQLFESMFARSTTRCRKLHRLARSVIVVDEAQSLPPHVLAPALDGLRELCLHYGASVVLSTATQPAFDVLPPFADLPAREIVPGPGRLFDALRRVRYRWRTDRPLGWREAAAHMLDSAQALAIVNTKRDALCLLEALADPDALHLSTLLCGAHRRAVIGEVRARLAAGEPCRLVATQVVEAGVDLDFPLVLRAMGPLDAIIQAAGRCNREGRLERGTVLVFEPAEGRLPPGAYTTAAGVCRAYLGDGGRDLDDPAVARGYYEHLLPLLDPDPRGVQERRAVLDFPEVARRFRMIDDDTEAVVVPYGAEDERRRVGADVAALRAGALSGRDVLRRLQPYLVAVRSRELARWRQRGLVAPVVEGVGEWLGAYDPVAGLTGAGPDLAELVV